MSKAGRRELAEPSPTESTVKKKEILLPSPLTEETITISKAHYDSLVEDADKLLALESGGVDNWNGYDDSLDMGLFEVDGKEKSFREMYY